MVASILLLFLSAAASAQSQPPTAPLTLDEAISMALKSSSALQQARDALAAQEQAEKIARADLFPALSATYQYTRLKDAPYILFNHQPFDMNDVNQFHWDVTLRQPLFTGFALTSRLEMEKLGVDVKSEEERQAVLSVVKGVKNAYYSILLAEQFRKTADEAVDQLAAHEQDAQKFYDQGLIPYNDLLKSQVALANNRQAAARAKSRVEMAVSTFNTLVSLPIDAKTRVQEVQALPPVPSELAPLMAEAVENRPAVQALHLALKQAELGVSVAKSAYYPDVFMAGSYEQDGQNAAASDNDYGNSHNAGVSVTAQWDLMTWGKRHARVLRQEREKDGVAAQIRIVEDNVRLEVKQAFLDLKVADENIRTAEQTLDQAKENFRITDVQYKENIASSLDVIDARLDLTMAETNYYGALYGFRMAAAELDRAVGRLAEAAFIQTGKRQKSGWDIKSLLRP